VLAALVLHNFLQSKNGASSVAGATSRESVSVGQFRSVSSRQKNFGKEVRNTFANYFITNGQVTWQWNIN
jgi:hypothetical protein